MSRTVYNDYTQPKLNQPNGGWLINSVDLQVVTKSEAWTQNQTARLREYQVIKDLGANYVSIAVPYDNTTKFTNYVTDARTKGFKILYRSHWNSWEGDNSANADLSAQDYLDNTYDFIINNSSLFQDGDCFAFCVECSNANDIPNTTYPFRTGNVVGGDFDMTLYKQFCIDQVNYANSAFRTIDKKVVTSLISHVVSLLNLNGETLDGNVTGNNSGFNDSDIVTYFGGILSIDHYLSDSYRLTDSSAYWNKFSVDLDKLHRAFPNCKIMISEWGYHTTTTITEIEREAMFSQIINILRSKDYIYGVNFWTHMGSSTASIFPDSSGTILPAQSRTKYPINIAFTTSNAKQRRVLAY